MNPTDPIVPQPGLPEKLAERSVQAVGQAALFSVGALLVVSWLLTAPIFHVIDLCRARLGSRAKREIHS